MALPPFLQATTLSPTTINILMFGLLLIVFYFFMIRPQTQRAKQQTAFQESLTKGMPVVTSSGILGRVSKIDTARKTVTLEVGKGTYLEFTQSSVSRDLTEAMNDSNAA